eukprot:11610178-Prorocentrum_lima.AAC.1
MKPWQLLCRVEKGRKPFFPLRPNRNAESHLLQHLWQQLQHVVVRLCPLVIDQDVPQAVDNILAPHADAAKESIAPLGRLKELSQYGSGEPVGVPDG